MMREQKLVIYLLVIYQSHRSYPQEYNEDFSYAVVSDDSKFGAGTISIVNGAHKSAGAARPVATAKEQEAVRRARILKDYFWRVFQNITNFDRANKTFHESVKKRLKFVHVAPPYFPVAPEDSQEDNVPVTVDIDDLFNRWRDRLQEYLQPKVDALKRLVRAAESVVINYPIESPPFDEACSMQYVDVREPTNESDFLNNTNAIHIPIGVVNCSGIVQRDITWLGHDDLTRTFEENLESDPTILRQYIAAVDSGVTRLFPVSPWKLDPPHMTVDLFDPRSRHWFIRATTCPKDILFLVDLSGSVAGQTRHLMKLTIMTILTTLTPDDYINAVWYNKDVGLVISKCFDGFIPATTRNKMMLQRHLDTLVETHEADFEKALNFTYDEFLKWENISNINADLHYGSGCHKLLFILTDTVQETGHELFAKYGFNNDTLDIRIFGFAMGFNTPDIEALQLLSCRRNGGYFKVDSLEDIKEESRAYLSVLSRSLAMAMHEREFDSRPVSWTGPYMDAQHEGPVLTLSMPILNRLRGSRDDSFLAVAAVDVTLSTLLNLADKALTSADSYLFAVDNNGNILFHPNLYTPESDLQMIRRAACFEATPAKRKSEADKVIYWEATEEIIMQMGLMDSIFTIDLAEIETPTPQLLQIRENMVSGECDEDVSYTSEKILQLSKRNAKRVDYAFRCRKLPDTPYSLGLARKRHNSAPSTTVKEKEAAYRKTNFSSSFVVWIPSPRIFCKTDLAAEKLVNRWPKFIEKVYEHDFECNDAGRTTRLLLDYDAINQWLNNTIWLESDVNVTCEKVSLAFQDVADLVFIQTEGGVTAFYPKCNFFMPSGFAKDVYQSDYYQNARLWPEELSVMWAAADGNRVTVSAAIHDQEHDHTLAVVATQVPITHVWDWWRLADNQSAVGGFSNCWNNYGQSVCYLMTRYYMIIGSSSLSVPVSPRLHLGMVEPSLFEHLVNRSGDKLNIRSLVASLLSAPVDARLPNCFTERPRNDEQCVMEYQSYAFEFNGTFGQGAFYDDGCQTDLYFSWTKIERTNLFLIEVSRSARECQQSRPTFYSLTPVRKNQCDELEEQKTLRSRRRYREDCFDFHEKESKAYNEEKCSGATHKSAALLTVASLALRVFMRWQCV